VQTFVQPTLLESKEGLLDINLTVSYINTRLSGLNPLQKHPVFLRAYGYGTKTSDLFGPTLVVRGGDQLRIKLINKLPFNQPAAPNDLFLYMKPNTTNLHTHGLHVYPGIYNSSSPLEYGDYVVDSNSGGVVPQGDARQYVYNLPVNHPAGPFFYHPQFHGSSALQGASLMQGAIMVRGPVDDLPDMALATELIFLFQAPYFANTETSDDYEVKVGSLEKFIQIGNHPKGNGVNSHKKEAVDAQPVLINGVRRPTILIRSGEVQRWRFINTQIFNCLNLNLDDHVLHQFTVDGWGTSSYQEFPDARKNKGKGIILSAGNRASVIVKAGKPGTYLLRTLPVKISESIKTEFLPGDILAKIIVVEDTGFSAKNIPAAPLPVSSFLKPISDEELACSGGRKRSIVVNMKDGVDLKNPSFSQFGWEESIPDARSVASGAGKFIKDNLAKAGLELAQPTGQSAGDSLYPALSALSTPNYKLQPSNAIVQYVLKGAVEEWTIFNCNSICRPFHIHVNPMYITKVNGVPIDPYWCDTVALPGGGTQEMPTSVTFRMRFDDFTGPYIMHSQMLPESDLGMIYRVTVLPIED
jgi:FtsP/CotA-like multicopper oxidase with cupredoxin domain